MKILFIIGVILSIIGLVGIIFPEITYSSKEAVIGIGSFSAKVEDLRVLRVPQVLSGTILSIGIILMLVTYFLPSKPKKRK